jgi:hypothetical protein
LGWRSSWNGVQNNHSGHGYWNRTMNQMLFSPKNSKLLQ